MMPPAATPRRHRRGLLAFTAVLAVLLFAGSFLIYAGPPEIPVGPFSNPRGRGGLPPGWKPWILNNVKRHTTYRVVQDGSPAFRARADASASGLMRAVNIDPREYPETSSSNNGRAEKRVESTLPTPANRSVCPCLTHRGASPARSRLRPHRRPGSHR